MEPTVAYTPARLPTRMHLPILCTFTLMNLHSPITGTSPSNQYFGINQSILYGSTTILSETAGIVDTGASPASGNDKGVILIDNNIIGTTLILLATQAYNSYQSATGAVLDDDTGLLRVTTTQYDDLKNLVFDINGVCVVSWYLGITDISLARCHLHSLPTLKSGLVALTLTLAVFLPTFT